jgi:hypothetical protein
MFLSKRNGVYYLWYRDADGNKKKVSTHCRQKKDALRFLQSFREDSPPKKLSSPNLSEFFCNLESCLIATHRPGTVDIYRKSWNHLLEIAGDIPLSYLSALHFDHYKAARLR